MIFDPYLPKLDLGVISTVLREIDKDSSGYDPTWMRGMLTRIKLNDPVFFDFLIGTLKHSGHQAVHTALITYRLFESQVSIEQLNEQAKL